MYRLILCLKKILVRFLFAALLTLVPAVPQPLLAQFVGSPVGNCPSGVCSGWVTVDEPVAQPGRRAARKPNAPTISDNPGGVLDRRVSDTPSRIIRGGIPESVPPPSADDYVAPEPTKDAAASARNNDPDVVLPPPPVAHDSAQTASETAAKLAELEKKISELKSALSNVPAAEEIKAAVSEQATKTEQIKGELTENIANVLKDIPLMSKVSAKFTEISSAVDDVKAAQSELADKVEEAKAAAEAPESNARLKLVAVILQILFCSGLLMAALGWIAAAAIRFFRRVWSTYKAGRSVALTAAANIKGKITDAIESVSEQVKTAAAQNIANRSDNSDESAESKQHREESV